MNSRIGNYYGGLRKAKDYYTSLPKWVPVLIKDYIEDRLWFVSKVHDNDTGEAGKIPLGQAHTKFIWGVLWKSYLPIYFSIPFALLALPVIIIRGHGDYKKPTGEN